MWKIDWFGRRAERARLETEMADKITYDEYDRQRVESVVPEAVIVRHVAGEFLQVDGYEIPRHMIEDIWIERHGRGPRIGEDWMGAECVRPAELGMVMIETVSGNQYPVECSRHLVERMYQEIDSVWKNGVAVDD